MVAQCFMDQMGQTGAVSRLLQAWGRGDLQARDNLMPVVYRELRRRAGAYLRRKRRRPALQGALVARLTLPD